MIGPLLVLLLGGAQGSAPIQEIWTPATVRLTPAIVLPAAETLDPVQVATPGPVPEPKPPEIPMFRLERAVVSPA